MNDGVRVCLPWWWGWAPERPGALASDGQEPGPAEVDLDQLAADELRRHWADLGNWVSWFVDRYHLADVVPPCWPRHPALVDELIALWYYHQDVTRLSVPLVQPDPVGSPAEPDDLDVPARAYWEWHEARWRWTLWPPRAASDYHECLTGHRHVDQTDHRDHAAAFTEASRIIVDQLFTDEETRAEVQ
jgi:hypothetical protein